MQFPSDEELFGMIPQKSGKYLAGNIDPQSLDSDKETLWHAYKEGMDSAFESMPKQYHEKKITFRSWAEYEPYNWDYEISTDINKFRTHAFMRIDSYIESHLNRTNGYIGMFPPFTHVPGTFGNKEIKYSQVNVTDYHYVLPQYIQDLQRIYGQLTPDARQNIKKYRLFTVLAALMTLVYYLVIVLLQPLMADMTTIAVGAVSLVMALVGTWIPYKGIRNLMPFSGCVILFLSLMFLNNIGLMCMADPEWHESIFRYVTYAIVVYGFIVFAGFLIHLIVKEASLRKFRKTKQPQLEEKFMDLMNSSAVKLHRYIRLRLLWCEYANESCPTWLKELQSRLERYSQEYDRIVGSINM